MTGANLAVVPARGGSKGVPRKNLREVAGRTLLERAIDAGRAARSITDIVVTTDDDEIAALARSAGAMLVKRPAELADDKAATPPVVAHAVDVLENDHGRRYDTVVLLQPPAPLRTGADVDATVAMLADQPHLDSVVSVYQVGDSHPGRMYRIGDDQVLDPLYPELENARRQDLPPVFHRNGAIYTTRVSALRRTGQLLAGSVGAYVMDAGMTVNIDTPDDLVLADIVVARWDESS